MGRTLGWLAVALAALALVGDLRAASATANHPRVRPMLVLPSRAHLVRLPARLKSKADLGFATKAKDGLYAARAGHDSRTTCARSRWNRR